MYQRILVATDGTELSQKAVRSAIALAAALRAELVALHVVPPYPVSYFEGGMTVPVAEVERAEKKWADDGRLLVDRVRQDATAAGVSAQGVVVRGDLVAEAVLDAAKKHACDLVVMASHGRRGVQRVLLGSETQNVLTHGTVPVLVVR